ncbi:hypothetical protein [Kitasatospora sp. NPDC087315]|uniref:hypothetical protein n=1 Tax=Kitasatospora sp. NPDC087315 TaxID=3364069 RepID=UPI0037F60E1D
MTTAKRATEYLALCQADYRAEKAKREDRPQMFPKPPSCACPHPECRAARDKEAVADVA